MRTSRVNVFAQCPNTGYAPFVIGLRARCHVPSRNVAATLTYNISGFAKGQTGYFDQRWYRTCGGPQLDGGCINLVGYVVGLDTLDFTECPLEERADETAEDFVGFCWELKRPGKHLNFNLCIQIEYK